MTVIKELKVKQVIIGKQYKNSENLQRLINLSKEKKVKIIIVEAGDQINMEKDLCLKILWPDDNNIISENIINNNSLVCKLIYKKFSMIFTGDIEEIAENKILNKYKDDLIILKSNILKVAHHGSKTSSTQKFIESVSPQVSLIGVGKNNTFGHPNNDIVQRLECCSKLYRTDQMGEISVIVSNNGKIKVKKFVKK